VCHMSDTADIAVFSPDRNLKLIVEVKGNRGATAEWASQLRRNLIAHEAIPRSPFFMLALPDKLYLWRNGSDAIDSRPADFVADSEPIISAYLDDRSPSPMESGGHGLDLIFASWLNLLTIMPLTEEMAAPHERWLLDSGLYDAIKNGSVETAASS
jgi:hypothetical protein